MPPRQTHTNGSKGEDRDTRGRFRPGHSMPGPGNPHMQRIREYNAAIREAIKVEDLRRLMKKLLVLAEAGDMIAAKLLLDRTLGKSNTMPVVVEGSDIGIGELANTSDVKRASESILRAMTEGRITSDDGAKLATVVELVRRAIETHELGERVAALEKETR